VVGDRVLAVEEHRVLPQRRRALDVVQLDAPVLAVLREVELGRAPVPLLPAGVEVLVGDLRRGARRHAHRLPVELTGGSVAATGAGVRPSGGSGCAWSG